MQSSLIKLSPLVVCLLSLIFAQCVVGSRAFSCTQVSKSSFRYYTNDDRCGIDLVPTFGTTSTARRLYKDTRQGMEPHLPPVYSSIASRSWSSAVEAVELDDVESAASPVKQMFRGITSVFGVVADVVIESILRGPPKLLEEKKKIEISTNEQIRVITLVDINWLKAHEEIVSEDRVHKLKEAILGWNSYRLPLLVDARSGAILDGHHRYAVGRVMGLSRLPVILVDYLNDDTISVDVWPECGSDCLSKEDVIEMSLSDGVFPPKTSKHDFLSSLETINVPLSKLV
jgi:hypothetical protein